MENEPLVNTAKPPRPRKQMHGCLVTWLWVIIIANVLGVVLSVLNPELLNSLALPGWYLPVAAAATVFVVIFAVALLRWKRWGFWGLVAMQGVSALASIAESGNYYSIISAVIGVAILVMLLNMGGEKKAWNLLE